MSTPEKTKQSLLPGFGLPVEEYDKPKRRKRWYYLRNLRDDTMLIIGDCGDFDWVLHDTVSNTPHLFAARSLARLKAAKYNHVTVAEYLWKT